ncbi:hypothetical protein SMA90_33350, partial [Escherichia coli]
QDPEFTGEIGQVFGGIFNVSDYPFRIVRVQDTGYGVKIICHIFRPATENIYDPFRSYGNVIRSIRPAGKLI